MQRTSLGDHPCSIARTLDVAGEWWTLLIVRDLAYGVSRFRDLQDDLGVSANVLSDRLATLVAEGIVCKRVYQEHPPRSEYHLTEKGADLIPALLALMAWGDRWQWPASQGGPVRAVHDACGTDVEVHVDCPTCARAVQSGELRARVRRGHAAAPESGAPGAVSAARLSSRRGGVALATPDDATSEHRRQP